MVAFANHSPDGAAVRHWQRWDDDRLTSWERGHPDSPDLLIHRSLQHEHESFFAATTAESVAATTLVAAEPTSRPTQLPPSFDVWSKATGGLEPVLGASLVAQFTCDDDPAGGLGFWLEFTDGRATGAELGRRDDADVELRCPFGDAIAFLFGCRPFSAFAARTEIITDDLFLLAALTGLVARPQVTLALAPHWPATVAFLDFARRLAGVDCEKWREDMTPMTS
ncbi:hypothetical protein BH20ACT2_BH20ACT2_03060 [soil metagenome]